MPTRILVVAEAEADWRMVTHLIDRKSLHHAPDWMKDDPESIAAHREWCGLEANTAFTTLSRLKRIAKDKQKSGFRGAGPLGFSSSMPRGYEWPSLRKVFILSVLGPNPGPDVIVYTRDMDRQLLERKESIEDAISKMPDLPFAVVMANANPKREAWILNGFVASNASEEARLQEVRDELHFDPCEAAEGLDASTHGALKDAKRVLRRLTGSDPERELDCLNAPWGVLRQRGKGTGLADFLDEIKRQIVPRVTGQPAHLA